MKKKLLGLLILMGLSIPAYASIAVSPTKIELDANKMRTNYATCAVEVKGSASAPVRYRVYTNYFTISDNATMEVKPSTGDPHDISQKLRFVPSEFTVPPGKSQKLRINIANIKNLPDGESRAVIFVEDVNTKEVNFDVASGIGAQLVLKTRVGIPVYVDKGKFVKKADIESYEVAKVNNDYCIKMKIVSLGNSKIRYGGRVQIIKDRKLIAEMPLNGGVVAHDGSYQLVQKIKSENFKEAGDYTIRTVMSYGDENGNKKSIKKDAILQIKGEI